MRKIIFPQKERREPEAPGTDAAARWRIPMWVAFACALAAWAFILYNGTQNSVDSNSRSGFFVNLLKPLFDRFGSISDETFSYIVRKCAHAIEYAMLAFFVGLTGWFRHLAGRRPFIAEAATVVLGTAVLDEFLQGFCGRTSAVKDVVIDTCGGIAGWFAAFAVYGILLLLGRRKQK